MPSSIDPLDQTSSAPPICPAAESRCHFLDELLELRTQVNLLTAQVHTDTLTGINNFRFFQQTLEQEMERTRRTNQATALIMLDLDYFKTVNDNWGHETGNQVLIQTARLLIEGTRRLDSPCRYGGEEFAIILPSTELITAIQVAERLRYMIENTPLPINNEMLKVTASFGVASYRYHHHDDDDEAAENFVRRTDEQLYRAKREGRNRVCHGTTAITDNDANVSSAERDALFGMFSDDQNV